MSFANRNLKHRFRLISNIIDLVNSSAYYFGISPFMEFLGLHHPPLDNIMHHSIS